MIDYEKLREACEIAIKLDQRCSIEVAFFRFCNPRYLFNAQKIEDSFCVDSVDGLITKLKELYTPKPKYTVGDSVWINWLDGPRVLVVSGIDFMNCVDGSKSIVYFDNSLGHMAENEIYPTKESLIDAQINYWSSLKKCDSIAELSLSVLPIECHHESIVTGAYPRSNPPLKCNHCGVLYYDNQ